MKAEKLARHLRRDRYGKFWLTDAIRPSLDLQVVPTEGFRRETYRDKRGTIEIPALVASVSRERLFDIFLDLLDPLGDVVDVVVETSHSTQGCEHRDLYREQVDLPVFKSYCVDFEDLLLHDGCTGVAIMSPAQAMEVQFDEHKLLVVYARELEPFEERLRQAGISYCEQIKFITEAEHLHSTESRFAAAFDQFCLRLGVEEAAEHVNW